MTDEYAIAGVPDAVGGQATYEATSDLAATAARAAGTADARQSRLARAGRG